MKLEIFLASPLFIERTSKRDVFLYSGVQQPRLLRCIGHRVPVFTVPWQDEKQRKKQTVDNLEMWKNTLSLPSQQAWFWYDMKGEKNLVNDSIKATD